MRPQISILLAVAAMLISRSGTFAQQTGQAVRTGAETRLVAELGRTPDRLETYIDLARLYYEMLRWDDAADIIGRATTLINSGRPRPAESPLTDRPSGGLPRVGWGTSLAAPRKTNDASVQLPRDKSGGLMAGTVVIDLTIDERGNVRDASVVRSVPRLDAEALKAVRKWRYAPTVVNGRPVAVMMMVVVAVRPQGDVDAEAAGLLDQARINWDMHAQDDTLRALEAVGRIVAERQAHAPKPSTPSADGDQPVRVGGAIKEPRLVKKVNPVYPPEAVAGKVQGIVVVEAIIGKDGQVKDAHVLRSSVPSLERAALDAVRQWRYTPTLLDGVPVAVIFVTTVTFSLRAP